MLTTHSNCKMFTFSTFPLPRCLQLCAAPCPLPTATQFSDDTMPTRICMHTIQWWNPNNVLLKTGKQLQYTLAQATWERSQSRFKPDEPQKKKKKPEPNILEDLSSGTSSKQKKARKNDRMFHLHHCKVLMAYDSTNFILWNKCRLHAETCTAYFSAEDHIHVMWVSFGYSQDPASHHQWPSGRGRNTSPGSLYIPASPICRKSLKFTSLDLLN